MPLIRSLVDIKTSIIACQSAEDQCTCFDSDDTFVSLGHLLDQLHMENKRACKRSVSAALADVITSANHQCHMLSDLVRRTQMQSAEGAKIFVETFPFEKMDLLERLTINDRGVAPTLWKGYMLMYSQNVLPASYETNIAIYLARNFARLSHRFEEHGDTRSRDGGVGVLLLILIRNENAHTAVFLEFPRRSSLWKDVRTINHPTLNRYLDQLGL